MGHIFRFALAAGLTGVTTVAMVDAAAAGHRHRHHYRQHHVTGAPHQFVFSTPEAAGLVTSTGEFAGDFLTGIPGATTADPYQRPAYGYNRNGVYGPGYAYPGY